MRKLEKQIEEYLQYCQNIYRMTEQTVHNKVWVLNSFCKEVPINSIEELTNQHINEWIALQSARGCTGRTINNRLMHISSLVRYFQDMGTVIPGFKLRLLVKVKEDPIKRVYYSQDQIEAALSYANPMAWLLISLCYDTGLRISELKNLRLANISGNRITFVGKGRKARESYISDKTREKLEDWIKKEKVTDYLWARNTGVNKGQPECAETLRLAMRKAFKKAGIEGFYPHALRHSFATNLCSNGAPLPVVQKMMGHSNLSTTERYVHTFDGHLEEYFKQYKFTPQPT